MSKSPRLNASNARLLEQEADAIAMQPAGHHGGDSNVATQEALRLQAVHERNRNASAAVQVLLRIAEAENAADGLRRQIGEAKDTQADLRRLQIAGLDLPDENMRDLLRVDAQGWLAELPLIREHFAQFGAHLPRALSDELAELEKRLRKNG